MCSFRVICRILASSFCMAHGVTSMHARMDVDTPAEVALNLVASEALKNNWSKEKIAAAAYALGATIMIPVTRSPSDTNMAAIAAHMVREIGEEKDAITKKAQEPATGRSSFLATIQKTAPQVMDLWASRKEQAAAGTSSSFIDTVKEVAPTVTDIFSSTQKKTASSAGKPATLLDTVQEVAPKLIDTFASPDTKELPPSAQDQSAALLESLTMSPQPYGLAKHASWPSAKEQLPMAAEIPQEEPLAATSIMPAITGEQVDVPTSPQALPSAVQDLSLTAALSPAQSTTTTPPLPASFDKETASWPLKEEAWPRAEATTDLPKTLMDTAQPISAITGEDEQWPADYELGMPAEQTMYDTGQAEIETPHAAW